MTSGDLDAGFREARREGILFPFPVEMDFVAESADPLFQGAPVSDGRGL